MPIQAKSIEYGKRLIVETDVKVETEVDTDVEELIFETYVHELSGATRKSFSSILLLTKVNAYLHTKHTRTHTHTQTYKPT